MSVLSYDMFWDIHDSLEQDHQVEVDDNMADFIALVSEGFAETIVDMHIALGLPVPNRLRP